MDEFILKLSKNDIGTLLLGGEIQVHYGFTEVTVKLDEHRFRSELEVNNNEMPKV